MVIPFLVCLVSGKPGYTSFLNRTDSTTDPGRPSGHIPGNSTITQMVPLHAANFVVPSGYMFSVRIA